MAQPRAVKSAESTTKSVAESNPGNQVDAAPSPPPAYDCHGAQYYGPNGPVILTQPTHHVVFVGGLTQYERPDIYPNMFIAVISVVFCCPIGLAAIIKTIEAQELARRGDFESARDSSRWGKRLAIAAFTAGLVMWVIMLVINSTMLAYGYHWQRHFSVEPGHNDTA